MSIRSIEQVFAFAIKAQTALHTPNVAADFLRLPKMSPELTNIQLITEDDSADMGKGHEWAENVYRSHWDCTQTLNYQATSEFLAFLFSFGLGNCATADVGDGYTHTCTPQNPLTHAAESELPAFTTLEKLRTARDFAVPGQVINEFTIAMTNTPGRQSITARASLVGSGKRIKPSGIATPTMSVPHPLTAAGLAFSVHGYDYIQAKSIDSIEFTYRNNVDAQGGFYPGSGFQTAGDPDSGQIRGRMEMGQRREISLRYTVRLKVSSIEENALLAQTEGSSIITLQGATIDANTKHGATITVPRTRFSAAQVGDANGLAIVNVEQTALLHSTNGILTCTATNLLPVVGRV